MDSIKTAYSTAYYRLLLLVKSGQIGKVVSVEATCTSLDYLQKADSDDIKYIWNSINAWGPTALLPIFQILGTEYLSKTIISHPLNNNSDFNFGGGRFAYTTERKVMTKKDGIDVTDEKRMPKSDYWRLRLYDYSTENLAVIQVDLNKQLKNIEQISILFVFQFLPIIIILKTLLI